MRTRVNDEEIRRTYSLCSSPLDKEWKVAIKKVDGGLFSTFANDILKAGDVLEVMEPVGKFYTPLEPAQKKNYLAFAAGSGITPVLSIIKTTLRTEPGSSFSLVYGNKTRASIIFFDELEGLKNKFMDRFNFINILSRERTEATINSGRIDTDKLNELGKLIDYAAIDETFICGPEAMIFCIKDYLQQNGISEKKIHFELFTSSTPKKSVPENLLSKKEKGPASKISVKVDGRSFDFDLVLNSETSILDAALQEGADLPYACKGGMCCTCKARLLEGEVVMDVHWGLEHEEIEKGFILTCQSHPKTEKVVVDFDIK
jgi:ring-1,2-phenylacetyl-CoA epoxidase subunit PaaE